MHIRKLELESDLDSMVRIWQEVGWISREEKEAVKTLFQAGDGYAADLEDKLEATLLSLPADMKYGEDLLALQALSGLVVSPRARRQGLAGRLMTQVLEEAVRSGQALSALVMFEQGFYDGLGFGLGGYRNIFTFDPDLLDVEMEAGIPERLTAGDWGPIHRALEERCRAHCGLNITSADFIKAEMEWDKGEGYGLGFRDGEGKISHFVWLWRRGDAHGPLMVKFLAWQTQDQLLELLSLISSLGDQIHAVQMSEPHSLRLRDFITYPHKQERITAESKYSYKSRVEAPWQLKILDLERCVNALSLEGIELEFNLELDDPLLEHVDSDSPAVITGDYSLKLGVQSDLKQGEVQGLPTLSASIDAFTRLWLGAASPLELSASSMFSAPPGLLEELEQAFRRLPEPNLELYF